MNFLISLVFDLVIEHHIASVAPSWRESSCSQQRDIGLNIAKMLSELIRDNRKIVDRIKKTQIDTFINLLKQTEVLIAFSLSCFVCSFVLASIPCRFVVRF